MCSPTSRQGADDMALFLACLAVSVLCALGVGVWWCRTRPSKPAHDKENQALIPPAARSLGADSSSAARAELGKTPTKAQRVAGWVWVVYEWFDLAVSTWYIVTMWAGDGAGTGIHVLITLLFAVRVFLFLVHMGRKLLHGAHKTSSYRAKLS